MSQASRSSRWGASAADAISASGLGQALKVSWVVGFAVELGLFMLRVEGLIIYVIWGWVSGCGMNYEN